MFAILWRPMNAAWLHPDMPDNSLFRVNDDMVHVFLGPERVRCHSSLPLILVGGHALLRLPHWHRHFNSFVQQLNHILGCRKLNSPTRSRLEIRLEFEFLRTEKAARIYS